MRLRAAIGDTIKRPAEKGDGMERLWAPWRLQYIIEEKTGGCVFCEKPLVGDDRACYIIRRGTHAYVILNAFPYNCGHLMVATKRHVGTMSGLRESEWLDLARHLSLCENILRKAYGAQGYNVGMNLGRCAGAGVLGHLHVHVVPRWSGDTNFMSTTAGTEVLPEPLGRTYEKLKAALGGVTSGFCRSPGRRRRGSKKE